MEITPSAFRKRLIGLAIGISILILAGAAVLFWYDSQHVRQRQQEVLTSITRLKAQQINQWHRERLSEASYFSKNSFLLNHTQGYLDGIMPDIPQQLFRSQLMHIVRNHSYYDILIITPGGELLFHYREDSVSLYPRVLEPVFREAVRQRTTQVTDLYFCPSRREVLFDFVSPMISDHGEVMALMIFSINPADQLFPMIQRWPVPSRTAETMLIRVEPDSVVYLNQLRQLPDSIAFMKAPLADEQLAAAKAVHSPGDIFEGISYDGKKVLAHAIALDYQPWIMYSRVSYYEAYADMYLRAAVVGGFALMILLMIFLVAAWIYRRRQQELYRQLYLKQKELHQSEQEFRVALYSIADGVIIADSRGCILRMNHAAARLTGWPEQQAVGQPLEAVFVIRGEDTGEPLEDPARQVRRRQGPTRPNVQALLVNRQGHQLPVAFSAAPLPGDQQHPAGTVLVFSDQSRQREDRRKLLESEEKYRTLVEVSTDAIFILADQQLIYVNPAALRLTGATHPGQLLGHSQLELFDAGVHPIMKERIRLMQATGNPVDLMEFTLHRLDGTRREVEVGGTPFHYQGQRVIQIVMRDITERKQATEQLHQLNQKYRHLYDTMVQGVVYQDHDGVLVNANPAAERILGLTFDQMKGRYSTDPRWQAVDAQGNPLPGEQHPSMIALHQGIQVLGKVMGIHNPQSDTTTWIRTNATPLFNPGSNGEPIGVYTIFEDITRQKQDEITLRESEKRYRMLFESNPHPMWVFATSGLEFLDVNPAAINKYGYTRQEFMAMRLTDILTEEEKERLQKSLEGANRGFRFPSEWAHRLKDGTLIQVETSSQAIIYKGHEARLVLVSDITERKQNQKLREDLILVRQAVQLRQKFLASMSHEIRTPLAGIMGMTDLLFRETQLHPQQQEYLEAIRSSSEHLMEVVNNILDLSKIEAGKMVSHPRAFPFERLIDRARKLFRSLNQKPVEFITEMDPAIPPFLYADEQRIFQILTNLLGNAIKFTQQGRIVVRATLDEKQKNNHVMIRMEVEDTGKGIRPENQQKLFDLFSQVETPGGHDQQGTGLGLAISRELAHLLEGQIGLRSQHGQGATFWFTFRAQVVGQLPDEDTERERPVVASRHFLLVEDNPVISKVITLMLEAMGHQVTHADNGLTALRIYQPATFDMILMDIQMPVLDGVATVQKLKQTHDNLPPVVGLSANAFEGDARRYIDQGMDDYLVKPVSQADFEKMLARWFK